MKFFLLLYHCVVNLRNKFYHLNILKTYRVDHAFVISVGNITFGGTGKTPIVIALAEKCLAKGKTVAVVSRGYKRKSKAEIIVEPHADNFIVEEIGDEPFMIKKRLPEIYLAVGADRKSIIKKLPQVDYIILDDGFQKLQIKRDLNILLIDATKPFGNGLLRESFKNIQRADLIILTKANFLQDVKQLNNIEQEIRQYTSTKIIKSEYLPLKNSLPALPKTEKISLLTAVANPQGFEYIVKSLGYEIKDRYFFRDHHWFTDKDLAPIKGMVFTTEKDSTKLAKYLTGRGDVNLTKGKDGYKQQKQALHSSIKHENLYVLKMEAICNIDI
ncbi:MAG: tetraacyldisaccharide 4'-kinase [bacterium]|nr:tetraacyldisaccharide 4'-kinase [bacterium]